VAEAFREQYFLSKNRVSKVELGGELQISDFKSTFFCQNCPEFCNALFSMETFHEDPSMFFENFEDIESYHLNQNFEKN
jgi:hypothetical protein